MSRKQQRKQGSRRPRNAAESTKSTNNGSKRSEKAGNRPVREFLYLDYPKVTSYYAQLNLGLTRERRRLRGAERTDTTSTPASETSTEFAGKVGISDEGINVAKFLGIIADIQAKVTDLVTSGGDESVRHRAEYTIEAKELHHDVFSAVENHLEQACLIETNLRATADKRPFYKVSGPANILVFNDILALLKDWDKIGEALSNIGHQNFAKLENRDDILYIMERFYGDKIGILLQGRNGTVSTMLSGQHLTSPIEDILDNYGRLTNINLTVFGLKSDSTAPVERRVTISDNAPHLTKAFQSMSEGMEELDKLLRIRADLHLFPLALFVDLNEYT